MTIIIYQGAESVKTANATDRVNEDNANSARCRGETSAHSDDSSESDFCVEIQKMFWTCWGQNWRQKINKETGKITEKNVSWSGCQNGN